MSRADLKRVEDYSLSDEDIRKCLGSTSIFPYPQLKSIQSINDVFDGKGRCMMLILTTGPTEGHWVAMIKHGDHIEYFDPYGHKPDYEKSVIPKTRLRQLNEAEPTLTTLLKSQPMPVIYNTHAFQKMGASMNTCGRHCITRLLYRNKSLEDYDTLIRSSGLSPDDFVAGTTFKCLRK